MFNKAVSVEGFRSRQTGEASFALCGEGMHTPYSLITTLVLN